MRIIAGEYRGRILKSPAGQKTRPTSDRLRETLFNILAPLIGEDTRFLDLCAGTGAVGIEAVSRGAGFATLVDKSPRACALVEANLDLLEIPESSTEVVCALAEKFVARPHSTPWNVVFYDPPYAQNYRSFLFEFASNAALAFAPGGVLIAEHHAKTDLPDAIGDLRRRRVTKQGETQLSFYERR